MIQFQVACLCWSLGERGLRIFLRKEGKSLGFPEGADVVTSNHTSPERDFPLQARTCLLYTYDAADEEDSVDLGGRRIIKKKNTNPLVWIGLNAYSKSIDFPLPKCKYNWLKVIDTSMSEIFEPLTINEKSVSIKSRSSLLIISEEVFGAKNNLF